LRLPDLATGIIAPASTNRSCVTLVVVYAVLSLVSNISADTTGNYARPGSAEETPRTKLAAGNHEETTELSELVESIHQGVNEFRHAQGLQPLRLEPIISVQARQHSLEIARTGSALNHAGFDDRLKKIGEKLSFRAGAENVAASIGHENPARTAVEGWHTSPGHRKNMLGDFTLTGIGIAQSEQGSYFITQIFLKPLQ
jgi:uncharacterized protein YkwD